jgi:glycosyltransferase involved in cell wall biosynthesis
MRLSRYKLYGILLLIIVCASLYAISFSKKNKALRKVNSEYALKTEMDHKFFSSILPTYEESLSNITKKDYKNAQSLPSKHEKIKFCILISSYNNVKYTSQNLNSIFRQNYHNWRMKYIDDASDDGMSELVAEIKEESGLSDDKFTVERHENRLRSATYNLYEGANNFCHEDEVMVMVDGDDLLATGNVLETLAKVYSENKIWLTYGSFIQIPSGDTDDCCNHEVSAADWPNIRSLTTWNTSHLRTAYTWLFKKIKVEDLKYKGEFIRVTWDKAIMFPMLEMAGKDRVKYIKDIMYMYRMHPKNDHFIYREEQQIMEKYIYSLPKYKLLN